MLLSLSVALAAAGMLAHNALSLPLALWSPENVGPVIVWCALLVWYLAGRTPAARLTLLGWTLLNLIVGGILTVLPLPILPFAPEQTVGHYLAHVIYTVTQLPTAWLLLRPRVALAPA